MSDLVSRVLKRSWRGLAWGVALPAGFVQGLMHNSAVAAKSQGYMNLIDVMSYSGDDTSEISEKLELNESRYRSPFESVVDLYDRITVCCQ